MEKKPQAARKLNEAMQKDRMEKIYLAVTDGKPERMEGKLVDYLKKDGKTNRSEVVSKDTPGAKRAELSFRVLETSQGPEGTRSLVQIRLKTGRHHQIRVQMAHAGMPLCGDSKYHPAAGSERGDDGLALCACSLSFAHPRNGKQLQFQVTPEGRAFSGFSCGREK
ncbi:MAG: RluA family pseudouridine synthase [Lacrimispora saccharolytica]